MYAMPKNVLKNKNDDAEKLFSGLHFVDGRWVKHCSTGKGEKKSLTGPWMLVTWPYCLYCSTHTHTMCIYKSTVVGNCQSMIEVSYILLFAFIWCQHPQLGIKCCQNS